MASESPTATSSDEEMVDELHELHSPTPATVLSDEELLQPLLPPTPATTVPNAASFRTHEDWAKYAWSSPYHTNLQLARIEDNVVDKDVSNFSILKTKKQLLLQRMVAPMMYQFDESTTSDCVLKIILFDEKIELHTHKVVIAHSKLLADQMIAQSRPGGPGVYGSDGKLYIGLRFTDHEQYKYLTLNGLKSIISVLYGADPLCYFSDANVNTLLPSLPGLAQSSLQRMHLVLSYIACAHFLMLPMLVEVGIYVAVRELDAWNMELLYSFALQNTLTHWDADAQQTFERGVLHRTIDFMLKKSNHATAAPCLLSAAKSFFRAALTEPSCAALGLPLLGSAALGSWPYHAAPYGSAPALDNFFPGHTSPKALWASNLATLRIAASFHPAYAAWASEETVFLAHFGPMVLTSLPFAIYKSVLYGLALGPGAKMAVAHRAAGWRGALRETAWKVYEWQQGRSFGWVPATPAARGQWLHGRVTRVGGAGGGRLVWVEVPMVVESVDAFGRRVSVFDCKRYFYWMAEC